MTEQEKKTIATAIVTLADPVGNWPMAWESLCKLADLDPNQCQPPFRAHPFYNAVANKASAEGQ